MALEIRRRFGAVPIDARRETLDAITLHAEGIALAADMPVACTAGEGDAALAGRGRGCRDCPWRAALEDEPQQIIRPLARGGRDHEGLDSPRSKRGGDARRRLTRIREIDLVERDDARALLEPAAIAAELVVDRLDVRERV